MLTGSNSIEWSCEVRRAHVWWFVILPICGHGWICEGQGVFPPTHIWWRRNTLSSQKGRVSVYRTWTHKELNGVVSVEPRLVLVCCNVQDPHATFQWYEEFPMGVTPTV